MYVYEILRAIRKGGTTLKNIWESYITNAVVSSAILEYCITLETWYYTQPAQPVMSIWVTLISATRWSCSQQSLLSAGGRLQLHLVSGIRGAQIGNNIRNTSEAVLRPQYTPRPLYWPRPIGPRFLFSLPNFTNMSVIFFYLHCWQAWSIPSYILPNSNTSFCSLPEGINVHGYIVSWYKVSGFPLLRQTSGLFGRTGPQTTYLRSDGPVCTLHGLRPLKPTHRSRRFFKHIPFYESMNRYSWWDIVKWCNFKKNANLEQRGHSLALLPVGLTVRDPSDGYCQFIHTCPDWLAVVNPNITPLLTLIYVGYLSNQNLFLVNRSYNVQVTHITKNLLSHLTLLRNFVRLTEVKYYYKKL